MGEGFLSVPPAERACSMSKADRGGDGGGLDEDDGDGGGDGDGDGDGECKFDGEIFSFFLRLVGIRPSMAFWFHASEFAGIAVLCS